jgi:hypothetical protein
MGITSQSLASSIVQAGVIPNTAARPASPYAGQMLYQLDTKQLLIWDGAAWVMAVDTDTPPGLELVKTQTIGTSVTSVAVSDAFSATYDSYKIIVSGSTGSTDTDFSLQLTGSTTAYYGHFVAGSYSTGSISGFGDNNLSSFVRAGFVQNGNAVSMNCDLVNPNLAKYTFIYSSTPQAVNTGSYTGHHRVSTAYTGFTLLVGGGANITGGTVRVYGYRNQK